MLDEVIIPRHVLEWQKRFSENWEAVEDDELRGRSMITRLKEKF